MARATANVTRKAPSASKTVAHSTAPRPYRKVGAAIAKPLVDAVKREDAETLAKLVVAAFAPQIIKSGLRFVVRHPVLAAAGLAGFTIWLGRTQQATA